jgi:hypothetical protein
MADLRFGGPSQASKQARLTSGRGSPTPYRVEILENCRLTKQVYFLTPEEALAFSKQETAKSLQSEGKSK